MKLTEAEYMKWLPDMDLNHDKQIQSLLCYRYTIGQTSGVKVDFPVCEGKGQMGSPAAKSSFLKAGCSGFGSGFGFRPSDF